MLLSGDRFPHNRQEVILGKRESKFELLHARHIQQLLYQADLEVYLLSCIPQQRLDLPDEGGGLC